MMAHGGQVWQGGDPDRRLDFSANLRPEGLPNWVVAALNEAIFEVRYYPDVAMDRERSALSQYLRLPEDCVLPTAVVLRSVHSPHSDAHRCTPAARPECTAIW